MHLSFALLRQYACTDALCLPLEQRGQIISVLPGLIFSASSPQAWPAVGNLSCTSL